MLSCNLGLAIATHYCGGTAVESQLVHGHEILDCGMNNMDEQPCPSEQIHALQLKKTPCCENEYQSLDLEDDYELTVPQLSLSLEFIAAFAVSFLTVVFPSENQPSQYANYSPPLIEQDIAILYQVFLI